MDFGYEGWPVFDEGGYYTGPLPNDCGHKAHNTPMCGRNGKRGSNTSPTAAYEHQMCPFIARPIFNNLIKHVVKRLSGGGTGAECDSHTEDKTAFFSDYRNFFCTSVCFIIKGDPYSSIFTFVDPGGSDGPGNDFKLERSLESHTQ